MHVFDITAQGYDTDRTKLIPGFGVLYSTAVTLLAESSDHILDLGAGTGLLSAFVRARFPKARLHLIDSSAPMLQQAEARFARDQEVLCQVGDYRTAPWGVSYDAVVSALSIHHLQDEAKRALFRRVFTALKPGGIFVNAEQILQTSPESEEQARANWLHDVRALGATEDQIQPSLLRQAEDRCATVDDQLHWLRETGFSEPRSALEQGRFAVLCGSRPT